ncbi:MAG: NADH-quinone oxidoreductase subunit A [Ignavibacteriales bacterium CG07_land_8_20_14_0_80_59_12]|nr:MAG: NADH-quinone oxidoreductase subunit A [Ignavibacteriales bacterium CG07_land_8_20_14_0_80_59_12]
MLTDFGRVLAFFLVGVLFVGVVLLLARLIRPHHPYEAKNRPYECGEEPIGEPWVKFNIRFYVVALIFLIFDVEVVFLFPWATVFAQLGWFAFLEMMVFIGILLVGLAYVWVKGDLEWDKPQPRLPHLERPQPVAHTAVGAREEVTV